MKGLFLMNEMLEMLLESMDEDKVKVTDATLNVIVKALDDFEFSEISYYTEHNLFDFKNKLMLKSRIVMDLTGENSGMSQWTQTYIGDAVTGISETIELKTSGVLKHTIMNNNFPTEFEGDKDSVIVVETIEWDTRNNYDEEKAVYTATKQLYFYVNQENIND